ncbi:hypothetical protein DFP72DRAFT_895700 [Ephemerocybe angulata]|uniref:Uncharacterized protein n=1 Tax=Ephemerocybe angulata TaxID=980116 RepID=A0A8H6M5X4_9AGAR|nr:hypothetical protein DFP72DRAFT_895700 [Tulosesus angulatus]
MSSSFTLLVDDQDSQVNYLCPTLKQQLLGSSYSNNTWSTIKDQSCKDGWFQYTFYGTGIRVDIPTIHPSQDVSVTLDNAPLAPKPDGSFESPVLSDGQHTLKYALGNVKETPVFDYLTVTAGPSTPLNGRTLITDDADLAFKGNWTSDFPKAVKYDYATALYRDTVHWSSTVGDSFQYQFTGSSVSVVGLASLDPTSSRNITATYTIDVPMSELFHAKDLGPGQHTLVVSLTEVAYPQALVDSGTPIFDGPHFNGRRAGAIAGIAIGVAAFFAIGIGAFLYWRRSRASTGRKHPVVMSSNNSSYDDIKASKLEAQQVN